MWKWIAIAWIPVGRIYMVCLDIYRSGETWRGLFTKRIYRQLVIETGIFGPFSFLFDAWLNHTMPKKKMQALDKTDTNLEREFKIVI